MGKSKTTTVIKEEVMSQQDDEQSPGAKIAVLKNEIHHVNETVKRIETKLDNMALNFVTESQRTADKEQANQKNSEQDKAIKALEDWNLWAQRLVIGAVIAAALAALVLKGNQVF